MTDTASARLKARFDALKAEGRGGLVTFVTAGDPDGPTSAAILKGLPAAGADVIELGVAFSDPMADGPAIQLSSLRALKAGWKLAKTLELVRDFRRGDDATPIVLMGYYNPLFRYGVDRFVADAAAAGVDGLIVVDLPPEEAAELQPQAKAARIDFIRLATPTSDDVRLPTVLSDASGFLYYVAIAGVTGTKSADEAELRAAVARLKASTEMPVAVGFGIRTPENAAAVARFADAAVVGTAIVEKIAERVSEDGVPAPDTAAAVLAYVAELAQGVRGARG